MSTIRSVEKALSILQTLDGHGDWMGVRELARRVGLTPPTTHNLLKTLKALSYVESNPATKQYRLGLAAIRLGAGVDPLKHMQHFARPYIEALANEFDESVVVLTWLKDQAVVGDWIQAEHPLAVTHVAGVVEHPIILASGRVLLAFQDRSVQLRYAAREDLSHLGPKVPLTPEDLLQLLHQVAVKGFALTENVANSGIIALAAPVFDANQKILMAVGCSAPTTRTTPQQVDAVKVRLLEITSLMTQKLAGTSASTAQATAA